MAQGPRRGNRRLMGEINVVPYIDVMLVLLIIFMVTAPLLQQGIKVELPNANTAPLPQEKHDPLILSVDKKGNFYLNLGSDQDKPIEEQALVDRVGSVLRREPDTAVLVKADTNVPYGRVVTGMVLLQNAGAKKIGFQTDPSKVPQLKPRA
jgi:biopolymer transport protein TolR